MKNTDLSNLFKRITSKYFAHIYVIISFNPDPRSYFSIVLHRREGNYEFV